MINIIAAGTAGVTYVAPPNLDSANAAAGVKGAEMRSFLRTAFGIYSQARETLTRVLAEQYKPSLLS